jgi:hypothetical protein
MTFTVIDLTKEQRDALITEIDAWKVNPKKSYPRIYNMTPKGRKLDIDFQNGDAVKVATMLKQRGFKFT